MRGLLGIAGESPNSSSTSDNDADKTSTGGSHTSATSKSAVAAGKAPATAASVGVDPSATPTGRPVRATRAPSLNMSLGSILNEDAGGLSTDEELEDEAEEQQDRTFIPDAYGAPVGGERKHHHPSGRMVHPNAKRPRASINPSSDAFAYQAAQMASSYPLQLPQPMMLPSPFDASAAAAHLSEITSNNAHSLLTPQQHLHLQQQQQQGHLDAYGVPQLQLQTPHFAAQLQQPPQPQVALPNPPAAPAQAPRTRTTALPNKRRYRASTTSGTGNFRCEFVNPDGSICPVSFRRSYDLARHKESKHGAARDGRQLQKANWICQSCTGEFARKDSLQRHAINKGHESGI